MCVICKCVNGQMHMRLIFKRVRRIMYSLYHENKKAKHLLRCFIYLVAVGKGISRFSIAALLAISHAV